VDRWQEQEERRLQETKQQQRRARRSSPPPPEPKSFLSVHAGRRVLVADSSQVIRTSAAMVLEPTGIAVLQAENQMLAMHAVLDQSVDLVLLDSDFDSDSGRQFIGRLRSDPQTRDLPVILLAGLERKDSIDTSGAVGILVKPFDSQDLIDRVEQALTEPPPICPSCNHPVEVKGKQCPKCGARHHTDCWKLYDGCGKCQGST